MAEKEKQIISTKDVWLLSDGTQSAPNAQGSTRYTIWVYDNGEIWQVEWNGDQQGPATYVKSDPQLATTFRSQQPNETSWPRQFTISGTRYQQDSADSEPYPIAGNQSSGKYITDKYGNQVLMPPAVEPPGGVGPLPQPRITYEDPSADLARQKDLADLEYKKRLAANVGAPPQRAPQTQAEMDADAARARLYAAQATGAERDLQNPYILKQQQVAETIQSIQEQMARGEITPDEANKMMLLARQSLDAAMRGTTPFQMEQDRLNREQTRRTQQQNLAQNFVADRARMSGDLATGLLSSLGGIYGKIYSSTNPPAIDPFALSSGYTDQAYGGPELNDMALALLRSALGQGGM